MPLDLDLQPLLAPLAGPEAAGTNLRYTAVYDEIQEARRAEDELDRGAWDRPVKKADWAQVVKLCSAALADSSKDLQIACWLLEGLVHTRRFAGLKTGLELLSGLLERYWDGLYPAIEDDDLEFRAAPLDYLNQRLGAVLKQVPFTDPTQSAGYSWYQWQESRQVGAESDVLNRYGDVDEARKKQRDQLLAEGKPAAEAFDGAVALSSKAFYRELRADLNGSREELARLIGIVDTKFGRDAPSLEQLRRDLEDCVKLAETLLAAKLQADPDPPAAALAPEPAAGPGPAAAGEAPASRDRHVEPAAAPVSPPTDRGPRLSDRAAPAGLSAFGAVGAFESGGAEQALWQQALDWLHAGRFRDALELLLAAAHSAPSVRARSRCRLLMARLCLEAERPDLARPLAEELYALVEELQLGKWESPTWLAEVLDLLYRCLTSGEPDDNDAERARALFERICTADVTRAMPYRP